MKRERNRVIMIAVLLCCGILISGCDTGPSDNEGVQYKNPEAALEAGIREELDTARQGQAIIMFEEFDLNDYIILQKEYNGVNYYVLKTHFVENDLHKDDLYVGRVFHKDAYYCFERCSPIFALNTEGSIPDVEYTSHAQFEVEIEDLYFILGKIYDQDYLPYFDDELVTVDDEGIYVVISEHEMPDVAVKHKDGPVD